MALTAGPVMVRLKNLSLVCFSFVAIYNHKNALHSSLEERGRRGSTQGCGDGGWSAGRRTTTNDQRGKHYFYGIRFVSSSLSSKFETPL